MSSEPPRPAAALSGTPGSPGPSRLGRWLLLVAGAVAFAALVTLNAGGYQYGVSDQAFYIPVVLEQMAPELFPHDRSLIAAQDRFLLFDDWFAPLVQMTGVSLPLAFLVSQAVTLLILYAAIIGVGRALYRSWWAVGGLLVLMTIRHRIPHTGANSVEGYFHPRMLSFGVGLAAVAFYLHGRVRTAFAAVAVAMLVHPTIGGWYAVLLVGAAVIQGDLSRRTLLIGGVTVVGVAAATLGGALLDQLVLMDAIWLEVLRLKDYLVVAGWPFAAWPSNLAITAFVFVVHRYRRSLGLASAREGSVVAGCGLLLAVFLLSAPLSYAGVALAVQLQVNRVFWLIDAVAVVLFAWLLLEAPWRRVVGNVVTAPAPRRAFVVVIMLLAMWRGGYRGFVERPERPVLTVDLADSDWHLLMRWAGTLPVGTHFLADPTHAARYGTSVRVAGRRDVFLELVKDSALAIYSSEVAARVAERMEEIGDFASLTEGRAEELARRYDLDYLITEQPLALPVVQQAGPIVVYSLRGG